MIFYQMRYQTPMTIQNLDLETAFEIAKDSFNNGYGCTQLVIDEDNKIIYSLSEETYLYNIKFNFSHDNYTVYFANYFEDVNNISIITTNYNPNKK